MGGGRSASPPKQIGNTYFHMQGAGLNVILKVYRLHNMHPGNMWNTDKAHGFHGFFRSFHLFLEIHDVQTTNCRCKLQIVDVYTCI